MEEMDPEQAWHVNAFFTALAADPKGFVPEEVFRSYSKAVAQSYLELAIVRLNSPLKAVEILLSYRNDAVWQGWHLPGGMWRTKHTLQEGIASLAKSEGLGVKAKLTFLKKGTWEKQHDHPIWMPISHVVICAAEGIEESETLKWFSKVPDGMIRDNGHHARFFQSVLDQVLMDPQLLGD